MKQVRYVGEKEMRQILELHENGMLLKDIALRFDICVATVSNYIHGRTAPRCLHKKIVRPKGKSTNRPYARPDWSPMVFKDLPDDVLFQHVRECNFIG